MTKHWCDKCKKEIKDKYSLFSVSEVFTERKTSMCYWLGKPAVQIEEKHPQICIDCVKQKNKAVNDWYYSACAQN